MNTKAIGTVVLTAALAGCAQQPRDPVAKGEAYFMALGCMKCHRMGSEGGTWGPDLTLIGFRKSSQWLDTWLKDPHAWRDRTVMPNFNFPDETRAELVAYLSTQKGQAWEKSGLPWNQPGLSGIQRGEIIYNRAGCIACHAQAGRGGYPNNNVQGGLIPSLNHVAEGYTKPELMNKVRNGVISAPADPSLPAPMVFMPPWGKFLKEDEIEAVASYLISLGQKNEGAASPGATPSMGF